MPQADSPDGLSTAHVRDVTVALPEGMVVSPSSAPGLEACSPAQIGLGVDAEPSCPRASKLGTVTAETPLLEEPLAGEVFLAQQNENPFGSMLAMYLVVRGPGVLVKIPGRVDADPSDRSADGDVQEQPAAAVLGLAGQAARWGERAAGHAGVLRYPSDGDQRRVVGFA